MNSRVPSKETHRWPAEWETHRATWLSWPHNRETWPGAFDAAIAEYQEFARTIARYEDVNIVATGEALCHAEITMDGHSNVTVFDIPTNDAWIRDHGPIFLVDANGSKQGPSQPTLLDFEYNAWGEKYPPFQDDNLVPKRIADKTGYGRVAAPFVLEGGAVDGNGNGIVLTTQSCLLNSNRNPTLTKNDVENLLRRYLLVDHVLWLEGDISGDDTDGHIDQIARFVAEDTILYCSDGKSEVLQSNLSLIDEFSKQTGFELNAIRLPMPQARYFQKMRVPASYANFYILNNAVIVPAFGDVNDDVARKVIGQHFPTRETISLNATSIAVGLGAFHCLTQQQPAAHRML